MARSGRQISILALAALPWPSSAPAYGQDEAHEVKQKEFANPQLLVTTEWLAEHAGDPGLRVVDVRAERDYGAGHLRGAVSLPRSATFDPQPPGGRVGGPEQIAKLLGARGIDGKGHVVLYDEGRSTAAPRVFWTLEYYGHPRVSVLDGGFAKWRAEGRAVTTDEPAVAPVECKVAARAGLLSTKRNVSEAVGADSTAFVDARSEGEYSGANVRSKRGGRLPGAVHVEWVENFTEDDDPVFLSPAELERRYESVGVTRDKDVHAY